MTRTWLILTITAIVCGVPIQGHHSFSAFYHEDRTTSIEGELVEFEYRDPHAWVHVSAQDDRGQVQRYGAEWVGSGRLRRQGVTKDTLKPGDRLVLTGSPGRNPSDHKLHLKKVERPADGWTWPRPRPNGR